jgi:hypothetical protein
MLTTVLTLFVILVLAVLYWFPLRRRRSSPFNEFLAVIANPAQSRLSVPILDALRMEFPERKGSSIGAL